MSYVPTLVLRKIDPVKVVAAYACGAYAQVAFPTVKVTVQASAVPSTTGQTITIRDNNNCLVVIHMSNHPIIKSQPVYKPRCFWCLQDITGTPCPVPYAKSQAWVEGEVRSVFECCDVCCTYECALAYARSFLRDPRTEVYTRVLHTLTHPGAPPLRPAPDFRMLDANGGTMTVDEYRHGATTYTQLPSIVVQHTSNAFTKC